MTRRVRTLAALAGVAVTLATTTMVASTARADDYCSGAWCATVANYTNNNMLVAAIGETGAEGGQVRDCYFPWHGTLRCRTKQQPTGTVSGPGTYSDPDGFTFTGTGFYYNGIHLSKNQYVRVWDYEVVVCVKVPPAEPRCVG